MSQDIILRCNDRKSEDVQPPEKAHLEGICPHLIVSVGQLFSERYLLMHLRQPECMPLLMLCAITQSMFLPVSQATSARLIPADHWDCHLRRLHIHAT